MGILDIRAAFSDALPAGYSCSAAWLSYEQHADIQWQRLRFRGTGPGGEAFEVRSDQLRPETDLHAAARKLAKGLSNGGA